MMAGTGAKNKSRIERLASALIDRVPTGQAEAAGFTPSMSQTAAEGSEGRGRGREREGGVGRGRGR